MLIMGLTEHDRQDDSWVSGMLQLVRAGKRQREDPGERVISSRQFAHNSTGKPFK